MGQTADVCATEVLTNIEAMRWAVDTLSTVDVITVEDLLAIHARLLADTASDLVVVTALRARLPVGRRAQLDLDDWRARSRRYPSWLRP